MKPKPPTVAELYASFREREIGPILDKIRHVEAMQTVAGNKDGAAERHKWRRLTGNNGGRKR